MLQSLQCCHIDTDVFLISLCFVYLHVFFLIAVRCELSRPPYVYPRALKRLSPPLEIPTTLLRFHLREESVRAQHTGTLHGDFVPVSSQWARDATPPFTSCIWGFSEGSWFHWAHVWMRIKASPGLLKEEGGGRRFTSGAQAAACWSEPDADQRAHRINRLFPLYTVGLRSVWRWRLPLSLIAELI